MNNTIKTDVDYREHRREMLMDWEFRNCDYWFIKEDGVYHTYFLWLEKDETNTKQIGQHIVHATSKDFLNWEYQGVVLYGNDPDNTDDEFLATGSVVKRDGKYYMLYTGDSTKHSGMYLATSDDLYHWERYGNGPVIDKDITYQVEYEGEMHTCKLLADPYVYPEPIDGKYYAYINSWAIDRPKNSRGCQVAFVSEDLICWKPYKIALLTDEIDRTETCQVWKHDEHWYMSFGGKNIDPTVGDFADIKQRNLIYMAEKFDGPYLEQPWSFINYKEEPHHYIQKIIEDPFGDEVMLAMAIGEGVMWPYAVSYAQDGEIKLDLGEEGGKMYDEV